jgi:hypothetical protein
MDLKTKLSLALAVALVFGSGVATAQDAGTSVAAKPRCPLCRPYMPFC